MTLDRDRLVRPATTRREKFADRVKCHLTAPFEALDLSVDLSKRLPQGEMLGFQSKARVIVGFAPHRFIEEIGFAARVSVP